MFGFERIACAVPAGQVADPFYNVQKMAECAKEAAGKGSAVCLFPELAVTGASCQDLFRQSVLQKSAAAAAGKLVEELKNENILLVFGCPLLSSFRNLYNGVLVARKGELLAALSLPPPGNRGECFVHPAREESFSWGGEEYPLLPAESTLLSLPEGRAAFCNSLNMGQKSASALAPEILFYLCSGDFPAGSKKIFVEYFRSESRLSTLIHAASFAGSWESTADGVSSGFAFIAENGEILKEARGYEPVSRLIAADVDREKTAFLLGKRETVSSSCGGNMLTFGGEAAEPVLPLERKLSPSPFIPEDPAEAEEYFHEIFAIQTSALAKRLAHTGMKSIVLGLSGGLDSTLALLAAVETFALLKWDPANIHIVTMPGFGTSERTKENAVRMAELAGGTLHTISIAKACLQHFADIGHDPAVRDLTYENSQARERTQILMDMANMVKGLVLGTGDLSEIALGWCTYNGDHMSMYGINGSIPKTLMRYMVLSFAANHKEWKEVLEDVVNTPVSPELLPPDENGNIAQKTEQVLGAYELHDFYLYHLVKEGASPEKIFFLAETAFAGRYPREELKRTLSLFLRRFFTQQFKRSCMPEGPGASGVSLSPRAGDLLMPSDAAMCLFKLEE